MPMNNWFDSKQVKENIGFKELDKNPRKVNNFKDTIEKKMNPT